MVEGRPYRIRIEPSEHVFICGHTQFGKSYLATRLIQAVKVRKLIVDLKANVELPRGVVVERSNQIDKAFQKHDTVVFQPEMHGKNYDWDDIDHAFHDAYSNGNTTIYNDERGGWPRLLQRECLPWEAHCIMRGANRGTSIWTLTQRPASIPIHLKSESSHFFVFELTDGNDRDSVAKFAGGEIRKGIDGSGHIPKYHFWYNGPGMSVPILFPPLGKVKIRHGRRKKTANA